VKPLPDPTRITRITDADSGQRYEVRDYRGSGKLPPRPLRLDCDYCLQEVDKLWCRRTRAFRVEFFCPPFTYAYEGGTWNACEHCRPFVDMGDVHRLALRVFKATGLGDANAMAYFRRLFGVVFESREHQPEIVWSGGDPYPVSKGDGA
jgi:hypothetical protein